MIPRYALEPMARLFADEERYATWLEVEVLAVEALAKLGLVPAEDAAVIRDRAGFDVAAIEARERVTDHDAAAFVDVVQERVGGPAARWIHHGLTSSDVVDVRPWWIQRAAGPSTRSWTTSTKAAVSWSVTRSRASTAATSKPARSRTTAASSAGTTPSLASASTARTSTSSQVAYRSSSANRRAIGSSA